MRSHSAIYVDVGYLISSAATRVTGTSLRGGVVVDYPRLVESLVGVVAQDSDLPLLRVNWYDAAAGRHGEADAHQRMIGELPLVKLRLGRLNPLGEQKGVDIRIGLDLVAQAHSRAVDQMYLVSGDDDLTEAVEDAQAQGVQLILLVVPGADGKPHGLSANLRREADRMLLLDPDVVDATVHVRRQQAQPAPTPVQPAATAEAPAAPSGPSPATMPPRRPAPAQEAPAPAASSSLVYSSVGGLVQPDAPPQGWENDPDEATIDQVCRTVIESWRKSAPPSRHQELSARRPQIPPDIDRTLLIDLSERIGVYDLNDAIRYRLRDRFWVVLDRV